MNKDMFPTLAGELVRFVITKLFLKYPKIKKKKKKIQHIKPPHICHVMLREKENKASKSFSKLEPNMTI